MLNRFGTLGIFVVLVVVATLWSPSFLTQSNLLNVLRQVASSAGVMAVGMLFVILTRGIDLSVGSVAALGCVLTAYFIAFSGYSVPTTLLLVILSGAACAAVTGGFVAYLKLPSFVMSLAMMAIARGLSLIFSAGRPIPIGDGGQALADFGSGYLFGVPQPAIVMFAIFLVGGIVLNFTSFGRIITAIGSNEEAVRLSGIAVPRYILSVYVISGALAAVARDHLDKPNGRGLGAGRRRRRAECHRCRGDRRRKPDGRAGRRHQHAARRAGDGNYRQHHESRRRARLRSAGLYGPHHRRRHADPVWRWLAQALSEWLAT